MDAMMTMAIGCYGEVVKSRGAPETGQDKVESREGASPAFWDLDAETRPKPDLEMWFRVTAEQRKQGEMWHARFRYQMIVEIQIQ